MATKEEEKREGQEAHDDATAAEAEHEERSGSEEKVDAGSSSSEAEASHDKEEEKDESEEHAAESARGEGDTPSQLGDRRFVYAAYFAGAIGIAFFASKGLGYLWTKLHDWADFQTWLQKNLHFSLPLPLDEIVMPVSAVIGALAAFYYWRRTRARKLAEEVAGELAKVTWPGRTEVTNSTVITIITTLVSTLFFFLMDRFWGYVTDAIYKIGI